MKITLQDEISKKEYICVDDVLIETADDTVFKLRSGRKGLIIFKLQGRISEDNILSNAINIEKISKDTIRIS